MATNLYIDLYCNDNNSVYVNYQISTYHIMLYKLLDKSEKDTTTTEY